MRYLGRDSRAGEIAFDKGRNNTSTLQAKRDSVTCEHGDVYSTPFRSFESPSFRFILELARQDTLLMHYAIIYGKLTTIDPEITARCIAIINRSDPDLVRYMQYHIDRCDSSKGDLQVGEGIWSGIDQQHSGSPRPVTSL